MIFDDPFPHVTLQFSVELYEVMCSYGIMLNIIYY